MGAVSDAANKSGSSSPLYWEPTPPKKTTSSCFLKENMHHFFLAERSGSPDMIEQWIQLVHEKNALVSEESELMVA